jgi:hypothetical protein
MPRHPGTQSVCSYRASGSEESDLSSDFLETAGPTANPLSLLPESGSWDGIVQVAGDVDHIVLCAIGPTKLRPCFQAF